MKTRFLLAVFLGVFLVGGWAAQEEIIDGRRLLRAAREILTVLEDNRALFNDPAALSRMQTAVLQAVDPRAEILTAAEAERRQALESGLFYGIGVQLEIRDQRPRIVQIEPDSPAAAAGLTAGALIEKIDGVDTRGMSLWDARRRLRGYQHQTFLLAVRLPAADGAAGNVVEEKTIAADLPLPPLTGTAEDWPLKLAYIRVEGIYDGSGKYLADQFRNWATQALAGVVLDLRGARGNAFADVAQFAEMFAPAGATLFRIRDGNQQLAGEYVAGKNQSFKLPMIAIIDAETRGATQLLALLLRRYRAALLLGTPVPLDLTLRGFLPLADGCLACVATKKIEVIPPFEKELLTPDIVVSVGEKLPAPPPVVENGVFTDLSERQRQEQALSQRIGDDAALRRAADILLGLDALALARQTPD